MQWGLSLSYVNFDNWRFVLFYVSVSKRLNCDRVLIHGESIMNTKVLIALQGLGVVINETGERFVADSFEIATILPHVRVMEMIGTFLAEEFEKDKIYAVVGIGEDQVSGTVIAHWTARRLTEIANTEVLAVRACRKEIGIGVTINSVPREQLKKKNILVVTDVLATGATVRLLVEKLREDVGATVVGIAAIGEREDVTTRVPKGIRVHTLFGIKRREPEVHVPPEKNKRA